MVLQCQLDKDYVGPQPTPFPTAPSKTIDKKCVNNKNDCAAETKFCLGQQVGGFNEQKAGECILSQCATQKCSKCCNDFITMRLKSFGAVGDNICPDGFYDEPDTDYHGNDISCGQYKRKDEAAKACISDKQCKGFSIIDQSNDFGAMFGPWCLKNDVSKSEVQENHHFCMKGRRTQRHHPEPTQREKEKSNRTAWPLV
eukprot:TRINITY_DN392_c0_g2_i1.p2 TRINITY_DN392_c0_g2~~TRINITY_DN392_c0_g2_i1.p2  ORF type:complete len:212 (-),score=79.94 TRINITY_DN392_c0_g2_i1:10-606(-)